ncbi:hypothetical protein APHAL10511_005869 [Amanita phalloides]|nr:hypothetical protein APHAL10511_005869 [Amanita phalloides]
MAQAQAQAFVQSLLGSSSPRLTLTFAQSIDARIAGRDGSQLALSGPDSLLMTHWLRANHDAILVGIGTALNDDPQLNTRHLPPEHRLHHPRPIVLDSRLRLSPNCKLLANYRAGNGRRPYLFAANSYLADPEWLARRTALEIAGAKIFTVPVQDHLLHFPTILTSLRDLGLTSIMVEGGARVISSLLASHSDLIHLVVVTVAPVFVGDLGIPYHANLNNHDRFKHTTVTTLGRDTILALSAI